jgi:hypothetical protein
MFLPNDSLHHLLPFHMHEWVTTGAAHRRDQYVLLFVVNTCWVFVGAQGPHSLISEVIGSRNCIGGERIRRLVSP